MNNVFEEIGNERLRQDRKWGVQNHNPVEWIAVLTEEVGEAAKAALEAHLSHNENGLSGYRKELIQIAAVAVAMVECYDRNLKKICDERIDD